VHELVVVDLDPPVAIGVEASKRFADLFDDDARADKTVKGDPWGWHSTSNNLVGFDIIFLLYEVKQWGGQVVSELGEGVTKFTAIYRPRAITVEMLENILPVLDIFPQTRELVETDGSAAVGIEDRHQKFDSVKVERGPISID